MIKIKDDVKELSVHILQNPNEPNSIVVYLSGEREKYNILIELDKYSLVNVEFVNPSKERPWDVVSSGPLGSPWADVSND